MNKTKILYIFVPVIISIFCACVTAPATKTPYEKNKSLTGSYSEAYLMPKDYDVKELIFVTISSKTALDQAIIEEALLKRAKEVGADDIINVRIRLQEKGNHHKFSEFSDLNFDVPEKFEYHGNALAIKYKSVNIQTVNAANQAENIQPRRRVKSQAAQ